MILNNEVILILNFNTTRLVIDCINNISTFNKKYYVIVVDNNSNCENINQLRNFVKNKKYEWVFLFETGENLGYAKGNNYGLRRIDEVCPECRNVYICNPDIIFSEKALDKISGYLANEKYGIVSCQHTDEKGNFSQRQCWRQPTFSSELRDCFYLFRKRAYNKCIKEISEDYETYDVIAGCFFGIRYSLMKKISFFDENTFLFYEENILNHKITNLNLTNLLLKAPIIMHNHNESSTLNSNNLLKNYQYTNQSRKYYCKKILKINFLKLMILNLCFLYSKFELYILSFVKRIIRRKKK